MSFEGLGAGVVGSTLKPSGRSGVLLMVSLLGLRRWVLGGRFFVRESWFLNGVGYPINIKSGRDLRDCGDEGLMRGVVKEGLFE